MIKRKDELKGDTLGIKTSCGNVYVTVNEQDNKPFEVLARLGKNGTCPRVFLSALSEIVSLALANGIDEKEIIKILTGIKCITSTDEYYSCPHALSVGLKKFAETRQNNKEDK